MKNIRKKVVWAVLLVASAMWLWACRGGIPIVSDVGAGHGYSDAQVKLIAVTERNRYQKVYTDQIWQVQVDGKGTTFQDYLLGEIRNFMTELMTMNLLADQQELRLSGQEQEELQALAQTLYQGLSQEDKAYTGIDEEGVYDLYADYHRANKLVDELTKNVNLEISDSDAKVIVVQEIVLDDAVEAQRIYGEVTADGADFSSIAKSVSMDEKIEKSIGRGEQPQEYENMVFDLACGQVSPVIFLDNQYYIVKCINDYDEEATLNRKEKLALQRKNEAFRQIYDNFAAKMQVDMQEDIWQEISFAEAEKTTTTEFFELYQEYSGS